jgi:hypothetical protein
MTIRVVPSALSPDDLLFVPLGDAASAPGDRGTSVLFVYTSDALIPDIPSQAVRAGAVAASVQPFDELVVDATRDHGVGARRSRTPEDAPGAVLWFDEQVPTPDQTARAELTRRPPGIVDFVPRTDQAFARIVADHGGRAFSARWQPGADFAHGTTAWLATVAAREVEPVAAELAAAFGRVPHPPVLVGERSDFPAPTRRRMTFS